MGSVNRVMLVGHLGRDAEVRYTAGGAAVAGFSIATTENWTSKDGQKKEQTEWHRIVLWGKSAETLQPYLTKGKQIYVEGKLQTRSWEKDGQKHASTEIRAERVVLLSGGGKPDRTTTKTPPLRAEDEFDSGVQVPAAEAYATVPDDDIPFAWLMPLLLPLAGAMSSWLVLA